MKRKIIAVVIALILIGSVGYAAVDYTQTTSYADIKIASEKYVKCFDEEISSFGPSYEMNDGSAMAIVALINGNDGEYVGCIYFENDEMWHNRYTPAGIIHVDKGEVGASTEMVNCSYLNFVFGMEIAEENMTVSIPGMQIENLSVTRDFLEIYYPDVGLQKVVFYEN